MAVLAFFEMNCRLETSRNIITWMNRKLNIAVFPTIVKAFPDGLPLDSTRYKKMSTHLSAHHIDH
jgi:hypothetical protein